MKHPDGYIQLKDRSKDIIISGGENISSIEVEDALYKHPAVQAAAVVAKPDEKWGETPCAFVELKPSEMVSAEELIAWCRQHLAAFKCPRTSSSPSCRRPRRARSRNSACARWRGRCEAPQVLAAGEDRQRSAIAPEPSRTGRSSAVDVAFGPIVEPADDRAGLRTYGRSEWKAAAPVPEATAFRGTCDWQRSVNHRG